MEQNQYAQLREQTVYEPKVSVGGDDLDFDVITPLRPPDHHKSLPTGHHKLVILCTPRRNFAQVFKNWWLEISACVLALLVLLAFVITLWRQQGKPLQKYSLGVTINTLTAIYTIVLKTLCIFVVTEGAWAIHTILLDSSSDWHRHWTAQVAVVSHTSFPQRLSNIRPRFSGSVGIADTARPSQGSVGFFWRSNRPGSNCYRSLCPGYCNIQEL